MTLLQRVLRLLDAEGVSAALIGAAALAARGVARSTYDIDLLTTDGRVLVRELWTPVLEHDTDVDVRRGDADDPLAGVVRVTAADERPVDVVVGKWSWQARAVQRAERADDGPAVVRARDLVLLKLYAGGTQDLWDVQALLEQTDSDVLAAEVDEDLASLPAAMRDRWQTVRR